MIDRDKLINLIGALQRVAERNPDTLVIAACLAAICGASLVGWEEELLDAMRETLKYHYMRLNELDRTDQNK